MYTRGKNKCKVVEEAAKNFPSGMEYKEIVDTTEYIRESVAEVIKTLFEALILVLLVVFIPTKAGEQH